MRIFCLEKFVISDAMSVSTMRDSEADRFSWLTDRLAMVCSRRFCAAPKMPRWVETELMAESSEAIEAAAELRFSPATPRADAPIEASDTDSVSPELAPTWKVRLAPEAPESSCVPLNFVRLA